MTEEVNTEDHCPGKNRRHFATEIQKKIIKRWYDMCDEVKNPDILLLNGDLVDGRNYKGSGMGTWTTDVYLQAKVLADLVKMIKPRKIIATSGSPYHCDHNPNMDAIAVDKCGGTFQGGYATISIGNHRVYAQHKVSVSKVWQYRCYSEDTEVLTQSGWKKHNDVKPNESIAIYDPCLKKLRFSIPLDLFTADYSGMMVEFSNKVGSNILVTPNHKMWIKNHHGEYQFKLAEALVKNKRTDILTSSQFVDSSNETNSVIIPPATKEFAGHDPKHENIQVDIHSLAEFIGYYISEGGRQNDPSNSNHQVTFAQKDDEYAAKMESCFDKIGFPYSKSNKDLHRWSFNRKQLWEYLARFGNYSHEKHLTEEIFSYPATALKKLFEALILGDGSIDPRTGFITTYYTTSLQLANDVQRLATLLGYPAKVSFHYPPKKPHHHAGYRVSFKSYPTASVSSKLVKYTGKVVCFTTETGLYLTRRGITPNCYPTIQGNTTGIARALVMATLNEPEYGHYDVLLKSHAHYFTYAGFTSSLGMVLPCWKAHDEFGDTNVEFANPALGYVKFEFEDSDYSFNHNIFHFKQRDIVPDVIA